jgi:hypothetical protein
MPPCCLESELYQSSVNRAKQTNKQKKQTKQNKQKKQTKQKNEKTHLESGVTLSVVCK